MKYFINSIIDADADTTDEHKGTLDTASIKQTQKYLQSKQNLIKEMPSETKLLITGILKSDDETEVRGDFTINVFKGDAETVINAINTANAVQ